MSLFNPQIPDTNDPNWLGWSKPISQPGGDTSTGLALTTAAEGLGDSLKLADTAHKSIIEDQIYTAAKQEQDQYMKALAGADESIRVAQAGGKPGVARDILTTPTGEPALPADLRSLPVSVDALGNARANGKLSETGYAQRLDAIAKDFRSRYPGYKEYVDDTIKKTTGIDPANKYITSVLGDINSFANNLNSERNKVVAWATNHDVLGFPGMQQKLNEFLAGKATSADIYNTAAPYLQQKYTFENNKRIVEDYEGNEKVQKSMATKVITADASVEANNRIDQLVIKGAGGPQKVKDFVSTYGPGTGKVIPDAQWATLQQVIEQDKVSFADYLRQRYNEPGPVGKDGKTPGPSIAQRAGGTGAVNSLIADNLKWHDMQLEAIRTKDVGLMYSSAMLNKANSDGILKAITEKFPVVSLMKAFNDAGGPQWASTMWTFALTSDLKQVDKDGLLAILPALVGQPGLSVVPPGSVSPAPTPAPGGAAVAPPAGPPLAAAATVGTPYTLADALKATKEDPNSPTPTPGSPSLTKKITELPSRVILDPKAPDTAKINMIRAAFSHGNDGFLDLLKGTPSKYNVYTDLTSYEMSREIQRLGKSHPEVWEEYKRWAGNEFGNVLFKPDILELNKFKDLKGFSLDWDSDNKRIIVKTGPTEPMGTPSRVSQGYPTPEMAQYAKQVENRLNSGIAGLANIYKAEGKDVDIPIYKMLTSMGAKLDGTDAGSKLLNSIWSSKTPVPPGADKVEIQRQRIKEMRDETERRGLEGIRDRALPYNEENAPSSGNVLSDAQRSSLGAFLSNPAGVVADNRKNAPTASSVASRGTPRSMNLSDSPFLGVKVDDIPDGMSARDFIRQLQEQGR